MALSRGERCMIIIVFFLSIAFIAYMLRLYTRLVMLKNAGPEDFCLGLAMLCSIGVVVLIGEQVKYGLGEHIWTLDEAVILKSLKPFWASVWVYTLSLSFLKISLLLQYLRMFPIRKFRIICWAVLGIVCLCGLWSFFGSVFLCYPIAYFWDNSIKGGKCLNRYGVWFSTAGLNILTDFTLIALPMPILQSMALPKRQKRALMFVFALGGFGCIVSILRLQSLVAISTSKDPTWDNPSPATWSSIESSVGITCASLTALRPLLSRLSPRLLGSTGGSGNNGRVRHRRGGSRSTFPAPAFKGFQKLSITKSMGTMDRSANGDNEEGASELLDLGHHVHAGPAGGKADGDKETKAVTVVQQAVEEDAQLSLLQQVHLNPLRQHHVCDFADNDFYVHDRGERTIGGEAC